MSDESLETRQLSAPDGVETVGRTEACSVEKKGWLKGWLPMAICCAAPLLLLLAIPFLGAAFGSLAAVGTGLLTVAAVLACPLGMYFMMRMMTNNKK